MAASDYSSDEGGDYWYNRYLHQCNAKEQISFHSGTVIMGKFQKYIRKRHIASSMAKYKCTTFGRFVPFDKFFESYEGLLYLLKTYFEDVDIILEIDFEFTFETFPPLNKRTIRHIHKTIKEAGVFSHCIREQIRQQYEYILKNPQTFLTDNCKNFVCTSNGNDKKCEVHSPMVTEFRINIPYDSPVPLTLGFESE